jgi:hypothetical protein
MSDEVVSEEPKKKKAATSRARAQRKEAAESALSAYEQDAAELGEPGKVEAEALAKALAALKAAEKEQEELERKKQLKTEEVDTLTQEVEKRRANLGRVADNKFGARSLKAKAYRGK